jgi:hypothetical protein
VIDHLNLPVLDVESSELFCTRVLETLGLRLVARDGSAVGYGVDTWQFGPVPGDPPIAGLRRQCHRDYHAAFLSDPDGHSLEAVCRVNAP